jgi:hypothetical protein
MPGERRTGQRRTRGSWLPTLAGLGAVVLVVGGGTAVYLLKVHPAQHHGGTALSTKVVSFQSVGLVAEPAQAPSASATLMQLLSAGNVPGFEPVTQAQVNNGHAVWTADLMAGGTYIFIYVPTSACLASAGNPNAPRLTAQRCDLGLAQRWERLGTGSIQGGHEFYQFRNAASDKCLTEITSAPAQSGTASLTTCDPTRPASQMLAFWWTPQ